MWVIHYIQTHMKNGDYSVVVNPKKTTIVIDRAVRLLAQAQVAKYALEMEDRMTMNAYIKMLVYRDAGLE